MANLADYERHIIIENDRDKRTLHYLKQVRSDDMIITAIKVVKKRKLRLYLTNIARVLQVDIPEHLPHLPDELADTQTINEAFNEMFRITHSNRKAK